MVTLGEDPESFFVSYTRADERWAEWIGWQLEDAGHRARLMAWDFRPGADFSRQLNTLPQACHSTLIIP